MARPPSAREIRRPWLAPLLFVILLALTAWRFRAPPLPSGELPDHAFSARRAMTQLRRLLPEQQPHPVGTVANARVRERLVARLSELGLEPQVQRGFACGRWLCSPVWNVLATVGPRAGEAVLLTAHYDSVGAGPGVADDGSGVAVLLEVARVLVREPPARRVVLLFSDGEEAGLLGARAFVAQHPLAATIDTVVNLEARGSRGPSLMFETSGDTGRLVPPLDALAHPLSSSLYSAVYERLPNDTDLSVFKRAGIAGYNFGFIDGVAHYHTSLDDFAHLSVASLQHHGDNALALTRALSRATRPANGKQIWFDLLGGTLVSWPRRFGTALAWISALILLAASVVAARRRGPGAVLRGVAWALAPSLLAVAVGFAAMALMGAVTGRSRHWYGYPWIGEAALWLAALASVCLAAALRREGERSASFAGTWLLWAMLALVVERALPGGSYLLLAPAMVAAAVTPFLPADGEPGAGDIKRLLAWLPALVAFALWFPVALGLEDALGLDGHPAVTAAVAFSGASALPALTGDWPRRRWLPAMGFAGAAACLWLAALWAPPFSTARPQRQSIVHLEHGDRADWYVDASWGAAPPPLAEQAGLGEVAGSPMPWLGRARAQRGEAPRSSAPAPELRLLEGGDGRQRWHVRSRRGATMLALLLPPALRAARLVREGHTLVTVPAGARRLPPG
jgi:hypothetical protein